MDTFDAIHQRRAVKHYDPEHRLTEAEERKLLEAAIQAPSSFNIQHWRFVLVKDPALREQVKEAAWGQAQVTDASLLIVMTADVDAWRDADRYWRDAPEPVRERLVPMIAQFYQDRPDLQRDEAIRSMGIAAQTIMLAAKAMGLDSCPMIGFDIDKVGELIRLPKNHVIGLMIAIGKGTKPAFAKPGQLPLSELVITDRFV